MSEENKNVRCDLCGEEVSSQNAIRFDGTILCIDCFNQRVTECSHCGRSIWRDDSRNGEYCQDCYDNLYELAPNVVMTFAEMMCVITTMNRTAKIVMTK